METRERLSEEDVKRVHLNKALEAKWGGKGQIVMERSFTDGRVIISGGEKKRGKCKQADYLLCYRPNLPVAVVEAKDNRHPLGAGLQQAIDYAEILDVPFAYSSNGDAFMEHDRSTGTERRIELADFPTPEELWERYKKARNIPDEAQNIILEPYFYGLNGIKPRYYQRVAINRAIEAVAKGRQRMLLAMATGTGKTFTAFQIAYRLWKVGLKKKILFLADRNILIDQAYAQDFKPFGKAMHKITGKNIDSSFEMYFSLYHQLAGEEGAEPFRSVDPGFFDLIIIDECHRGSAKDESTWRRILDYFSPATHIGLTATPKETRHVSSESYFGKPIYTYSLRQGIEDGFLAPYIVRRIILDRDANGWRPEKGKLDKSGELVEDREYNVRDYDRTLVIDERTEVVAEKITEFLKKTDRYAKTIVFCEDTEHADRMRTALVNLNSDMMKINSKYVARITHDEIGKKSDLEKFISVDSPYPVIVTTSELLSTGVDCKTCKLIVLEKNIGSDIEFKQIIGRGTRLREDKGKRYFTIMDFRGATSRFANDDFWVEPEQRGDYEPEKESKKSEGKGEKREKIYVDGVPTKIVLERTQFIGADGKLLTESVIDYTRKNILGEYARLEDFLKAWNSDRRKSALLAELRERGALIDVLREESGFKDLDDFDLICHIAYDIKPLTRAERAKRVKDGSWLENYAGIARDVISALLDKYSEYGVEELADARVLGLEPFRSMGGDVKIVRAFGGKDNFLRTLDELQRELYAA